MNFSKYRDLYYSLIIFCFLCTFEFQLIFSQSINYSPQCNSWSSFNSENNISLKPPFITDSIFTWQHYQLSFPFVFSNVFFVDSLYGWLTYGLTGYAGGVVRTTDGGIKWDSTSLSPGGSCFGVHFVDRNTGWVVGSAQRIRKTTNGGLNWVAQDTFYYITYNYFYSVYFFNKDTGIITGERARGPGPSWGGCVLKTTNGGDSWLQIYSTNDTNFFSTELHSQFWINSSTGWMAGDNILLKTTDGGSTFTNCYSSVPPTQNGYNGLLSIFFINSETGWIGAGNVDHKNIYKTTNSGENWFFQDNPVAQYFSSASSHVIFLSPETGWAAVYYLGVILATTNGGTNWVIDKMTNSEFYKFSIYKHYKIWCAAAGGQIWFANLEPPNGFQNQQNQLPCKFKLYNNWPNPFNPTTNIHFDIPTFRNHNNSIVRLVIYDVIGRKITELINESLNPGEYTEQWNGTNYPSGIYFYRLEVGNLAETKKMVLVK